MLDIDNQSLKDFEKKSKEVKDMTKLKEEAQAYTPGAFHNIAELDKVPVDIETEKEEITIDTDDGPKDVENIVTVIDGEKYRIPKSVLKQLKEYFEEKPDMKHFKVKKSGQGLNTDYTVIPLD